MNSIVLVHGRDQFPHKHGVEEVKNQFHHVSQSQSIEGLCKENKIISEVTYSKF